MCLLLGETYGFPAVALRFFNTYGPRQALSNPYTGVLAIFAARLLNRERPMVFEDGQQRRDFVNVHDVARACRLAYERSEAAGHAINVGSGRSIAIAELARRMADLLGSSEIEPEFTSEYRAGDIRHCFADISKAERLLGFRPAVRLEDGLEELAQWLETQTATDRVGTAREELRARGLTVDSAPRKEGKPRPERRRHDPPRPVAPPSAGARPVSESVRATRLAQPKDARR
jgi:dTDP-L-rhamnose 4-epimerase